MPLFGTGQVGYAPEAYRSGGSHHVGSSEKPRRKPASNPGNAGLYHFSGGHRSPVPSIRAPLMRPRDRAVVLQETCSNTPRRSSALDRKRSTARAPGHVRRTSFKRRPRNVTGKAVSRPQGEAGIAHDCTQSLFDKDWVDRSLMEEKACSSVSIYPRDEALQGLEARPVGELAVPDDREVRWPLR